MSLRNSFVKLSALFILSVFSFTACDNFLQGEDVKKDIIDAIEYNNAKPYTIKLKADKESGVIKTPAGDEVSKKVTDTFTIKFEPEDDHQFIKWEAIISGTEKDGNASEYISFEDPYSRETIVTFKKAAASIIIRPVCPERLSVTKFNLSNETEDYPRDSSIILTFNRKIPEACSDAFTISIPGLDEGKAWTDYFLPAEINGKEVTFRTKYTQTHEESDLIPVLQNATKAITISLDSKKLWYTNNEYTDDIDINLDKDITYKYIVNSTTSEKTTIKFTSENEQCSLRVNDVVWNGQTTDGNVGDSFALRCKPVEGWCFCGWKVTRIYFEDEQQKTEQIPVSSLADINLQLEYEEGTNQYGFDSETKIAQAKLTVNNYIEGTITVSPVMYESLKVTFNMADAEKLYPRNSSIELTCNQPVVEECLDKITVRIPGLPQNKTASDYFEPAEISGNKIILKAKSGEGRAADMIPVPANGSLLITVIVPAEEVYYQPSTQNQNESYKVGLYSEKVFTYTINSETVDKTQIKLHVEPEFRDFSTLREGDEVYSETVKGYSVGKSFALNYKITDAYKFYGWHIVHTYTDSEKQEQSRTITLPDESNLLEELNLSVTYKEEKLSQPVFTIEKALDGLITIQPYVVKIATTSINIDGEHGTFTPAKGTNVYKVGVKNHIEFDAASDYAFLRWQVVNATTGEEIPLVKSLAEGYLQENTWFRFTDANDKKTDFELVRVPDEEENISFIIRPVVVERPRIISTSPTYISAGVYADTTIQVMFDTNIDENSIYFDGDEITELIEKYQVTEFLYTEFQTESKCYGYEKDGQKFFKNILITNSKNDSNLNKAFSIPVFENPRTLSIPVDKNNPLTEGVRVSVLLNDDFYTLKENKNVNLSRSEKWQYLVNGKTDDTSPTLDTTETDKLIVKDSEGNILDSYDLDNEPVPFDVDDIATWPYFSGGKFDLTLKVSDDVAVDSTFNVVYKKLYDSQNQKISNPIEQKLPIEYTNSFGVIAKHTGECHLEGLEDGVYSVCFEIKDLSGNTMQYPEPDLDEDSDSYRKATEFYYFCIDQNGPNVPSPSVEEPDDTTGSLNLTWTPPATEIDYKQAVIAYREWGTTADYVTKGPFLKGANSCEITGLKAGTHYEIVARYEDYAGNVSEVPVTSGVYTRPEAPKSVLVSTAHGTSVTLTCTKPDSGNFTKFSVKAKSEKDTEWHTVTEQTPDNEGLAAITINDLEKGLKYDFAVCSYDEVSDKYSLPYSTSSTETIYPSFVTIPNKTAASSIICNADKIYLVLLKPSVNNSTGFIVTYSTDESFPNDPGITKTVTTPVEDTSTQVIIPDLTPGTGYYFNFQTYYVEESNVSEANIYKGAISTQCAPVTNLDVSANSNTSLNVTWTAPDGGYDSYTISYQQNGASAWKTQNVSKGNTNAIIEGLQGGLKYNIKVVVNGTKASSAVTKNGCQTCPNPVRNLSAEKLQGDTTNKEFNISWLSPTGTYDGYKIYYTTELQDLNAIIEGNAIPNSVTVVPKAKGSISESRTSPTPNELYYIMMESYIGDVDSDSRLKTFTEPIGCSLLLDNVRNLTAIPVSKSEIQLSWTNPSIDFDGIKIYNQNTLIKTLDKTTTAYIVDKLAVNTSYAFKVVICQGDEGSTELTSTAVVSGCTYSNQVSSLTAARNNPKSINLNWTNPAAGTWSKLFIYANDEYITQFAASDNVTNCNIDVPSGGTLYNIKLVTLNKSSIENPNEPAETSIRTTPEPVSELECTSITKSVATLSWTNPDSNYSSIKIWYKTHSSSSWTSKGTIEPDSTTYDVSGLTVGTSYDFKVETLVSGEGVTYSNIGETSSASIQNYYTKPNEPVGFAFTNRTATSMTFSWTKPSGSFSGYKLYYKTGNNSYAVKTLSTSQTSYTLSGLSPATTYNVYLDTYVSSATNNSSSSEITKPTLPGTPGSFNVVGSGTGTKLSWTAPTNGAAGYNVYFKAPASNTWIGPFPTPYTSYTFANDKLSNGVQYSFCVTAYKTVNSESLESAATSTMTFYTPPASLNEKPKIYSDDGMGTVVIRWQNPPSRTDVSGINIYLDNSYMTYISSFSAGSYVTATIKIPNYVRESSHTFMLEPYHIKNDYQVRGPQSGDTLKTSDKELVVKGYAIGKTELKNIISGNNVTISTHPTDGGSFVNGRNVTLSKYSIGTYEVTNKLWYRVTGYNYSDFSDYPDYPKTNVSWQQAIAFCNKLSAMQGLEPCYEIPDYENIDWKNFDMKNVPTTSDSRWYGCKQNLKKNGYHLPTCAQWEFAARGGNSNASYFTQAVSGVYNWNVMSNYVVYGQSSKAPVGSKAYNEIGLYDMCGNVWEMLTDWNNAWPAGTFTDPYCEVRYHGTDTGEWISGTGQALPYNGSNIVIYRAGGCYADTAGITAGDTNQNLRVYATYTWAKKYKDTDEYTDGQFWAPTSDAYTGFRLCRNVTY